ncbi:MAG: hypothetical protein IPN76_35025 [Saprospiraceae bacterium]|nr:hypothetical protein [Saprospiraceae bacterium]
MRKSTGTRSTGGSELYHNEALLPQGWNGVQRLVGGQALGQQEPLKPFDERSYYVLSKPLDSARLVAKAIQGHWGIENNLHWAETCVDGRNGRRDTEDKKLFISVVVCLNNAALNLLRLAGYKPVKDTFAKFANKVNELYNLFESKVKT